MIDLTPYVTCALAELDPAARALCAAPEATLRATLGEVVQARAVETDAARHARAVCSVDGAELDDYQLRELEVGDGERVLAAIHFFGLNPARPFVGIAGRTMALDTVAQVETLTARLSDAFRIFSPHAVYFFRPRSAPPLAHPRAWDSRRILVGRLDVLLAHPSPRGAERVALHPASVEHCHAACVRYYEELHADVPALRERVRLWEADALEPAAAQGALCTVHLDGEPAGVIAAMRSAEHAFSGWLIVEEVLARRFRGRGLGAAVQRAFLAHLATLQNDFVLGTIDTANVPSLKTALRTGRDDAGGYTFMFAPGATPWFEH